MGTFACYMGNMNIPTKKRKLFSEQMMKILQYGGMMQFNRVSMYGKAIVIMRPVEPDEDGDVYFHYNYFEEDSWETAIYNTKEAYLHTEKIGNAEFNDVIMAAYSLYEVYDEDIGYASENGRIQDSGKYIGWINSILGTEFIDKRKFASTMAISKVKTSDFFYHLSDDDRAFWWDGTEEVIFSNEMDEWLKRLAERHKTLVDNHLSELRNSEDFLKYVIDTLNEIDKIYGEIYAFQGMFYEFILNSQDKRFHVAIQLLNELGKENEHDSVERVQIKRYLAVMANKKLRMEYFSF